MATLTGLTMLPGLLTPVAFADAPDPLGAPTLEPPRSAKVQPFTAKVNKKTAAIVRKAAEADRTAAARARRNQQHTTTWPTAGTTTVNLAAGTTARAKAGSLPVTATAPAKGKTASSLTVEVLDRKDAAALGIKGVVLKVAAPAGGKARLAVDYSAFASAYGGDWAGRLQLFRLPACADDNPSKAACRTRTELDSTNDRAEGAVSTTLSLRAANEPMMLALAAGTQSGAGDYKATPLSSSSAWEAGGGSGTFTWSYPLRVPPAAAGPQPNLALSYDSGSVDGRTANTNNQSSQVGEGFDLTSSYIERKYGSCDDDDQADKFDLCWKYDNASLVLNGKATELVKDDTKGIWRLKDDDASTVTHSTGADNNDDNGEYWTITTGNGTKYVFGLNKLEGASTDDRTNSVWTVPVFGDDEGEPGYADGTTFSGRAQTQAWRWNLDYVEDTHNNASTYWYAAETNHYDKLGDDTVGTPYVRGGYLKEIRYGQRASALFSATPAASNKVVFGYDERCDASGTGCDSLTEDTRDNWPDVPFDAVCKADVKCTGNNGPTFFTRKRLTTITTHAWNAAAATPAYEPVDVWTLKQMYLDPGDNGESTDGSLWLDEIRHTGKRGTDLSLDPVKFEHEMMANRVDGTDNILPLYKPRLKAVTSETGAQTIVTYLPADCAYGQTMPKADTNTKRCYPVYWSPNGEQEPILDWFQKYPVSAVSTTDPEGGGLAVQHTYQYAASGGAWHYNEDPLTPAKERTWSIWRGYERVTHLTGVSTGTQSKTVTVYLRGMHGDRVLDPDGKTPHPTARKTATVTGIKAPGITDSDQYAGFTRETVTYNGTAEVSATVNDPWSKRTATQHKSYADIESYYVRTAATHSRTNITSGINPRDRIRTVRTTYDDYGMAETVEDQGDNAVTGDEKCTRTWYARDDDPDITITALVSRTRTVARTCATTDAELDLPADSSRPGDVISDTATVYDNPTATTWSPTQTPTKGDVTWTGRAKGYGSDDAPTWQKTSTLTYDALGRPITVKDTNDALVSKTTYTPAAAGPLTATAVENRKLHKSTTLVDFATGATTKVTDPNGKITESEYDSLGRLTKVWLPNRSKDLGKTPNHVYAYNVISTDMSWVSTSTLKGDASGYNTSYTFYDSQLRPRQTQSPTPAGGRLITVNLYDTRGMAVSQHNDIWDSTKLPSSTPATVSGGQAPIQTDTTYDGAGRVIKAETKIHGVTRWTTTTAYTGDTVTSTAPAGGQATAVVTNALGQTTERREYAGPQPTGTGYTSTRFTYHPAGQQATITGPDQTAWSYTYDLFGRQTAATDPDKGKTTTHYNALDQVESTTPNGDASKKLLYEYDVLGRKTGMWQKDQTDANKLAAWTFDTLDKGQQDTAVRYDGGATLSGKAYTQKVTAYDSLYNATSSELILPEGDAFKAELGTTQLKFTAAYRVDGTVAQTGSPAVGGLPSEIVSYTYSTTGQQLTARGTTGYLQGAAFSPQGDLRQLRLGKDGTAGKQAYITNTYENGTRRLTGIQVTDDVHSYPLQDLTFTQDDAGNVTSIFDTTTLGGTAKPDHQCFAYDGYSRMTEAWTPKTADCAATGRTTVNIDGQAPYWTTYTYNAAGQRATETQHRSTGDAATTYAYNDTTKDSKPHTLDKTTGARTSSYTYDSSGNTTSRPGPTAQQTLTWDAEGELTKLTEGTKETGYLYDANGELLIRKATGDGDSVLYLGDTELRLSVKGTTKTLRGTRYYRANGQTIAVRTATAGISGTKLSFLATDHHGTSNIAMEADTFALTKRYTTPFGAPRGTNLGPWPDDKAFLGKPADNVTGLTHIGAREYDPTIGQFVSVDPLLVADAPQSLNGYSYAGNSPVTSADPTGMCAEVDCPTRPCALCENTTPGTKPGPPQLSQNAQYAQQNSNSGTAATTSTGQTMYDSGTGEVLACAYGRCIGNVGPTDTETYAGNYLSSLLTNGDFWSGLIDTIGGSFAAGGGGVLFATGVAECAVGVLCAAGVPSMALGASGIYYGNGKIGSGSDKLGQAFREADGAAAGSSSSGEVVNQATKASVDEMYAAEKVASQGHRVVLRDPPADGGTRGVNTSDVLIDGIQGDIYSPKTGNMDRIAGSISSKRDQVEGGYVILNLKNSPIDAGSVNVGELLHRVNGGSGRSALPLRGIFVIQ